MKRDLAAAKARALQLPNQRLREQALQRIVASLSLADEKSAWEFVQSLPPGKTRTNGRQSLLGRIAYQDPMRALDYAAPPCCAKPAVTLSRAQKMEMQIDFTNERLI